MILNKIGLLFSLTLIFITNIFSLELPELTLTTEDWKPFQYIENSRNVGISVDLMDLMLKDLKSKQSKNDIKFLPWTRAYTNLKNNKNTVLFLTARTNQRENMFKWVGPLLQYKTYLIAKKSSKIKINNAQELKKYKIGTVKDDAGENFLKDIGLKIEDFTRAKNGSDSVFILEKGKIDLHLSEWTSFVSDVNSLNLDINDFEPVYISSQSELYFAFSLNTDDEIVNAFQDSFNKLQSSGSINKIFNKYSDLLVQINF